jgi:uncharacterized protein DUF5666
LEEFVKTRLLLGLVTLLFVAGAACAHGDKKHLLGTVEKINNSSIVVKTTDGKSVEVKIVASTVFTQHNGAEDRTAKFTELATGNRVVIHATANGTALEADEIKFSRPGAGAHGASAPAAKAQP